MPSAMTSNATGVARARVQFLVITVTRRGVEIASPETRAISTLKRSAEKTRTGVASAATNLRFWDPRHFGRSLRIWFTLKPPMHGMLSSIRLLIRILIVTISSSSSARSLRFEFVGLKVECILDFVLVWTLLL